MSPRYRKTVWAKLTDPAVLMIRIRECKSSETRKRHKNGFAAVAKLKVGPSAWPFKETSNKPTSILSILIKFRVRAKLETPVLPARGMGHDVDERRGRLLMGL